MHTHITGGALATIASLDVSIRTIPRVNAYLKKKRELDKKLKFNSYKKPSESENIEDIHIDINNEFDTIIPFNHKNKLNKLNKYEGGDNRYQKNNDNYDINQIDDMNNHDSYEYSQIDKKKIKKIKVTMYNYGSPRVGNGFFALLYNRIVPGSFRTVIDGDLVTSMPPTRYRHIGTQAVVDNLGAGSIIIDPSFIERRLRTHTKSSVSVHSLLVYRKGLNGVKHASEYMKEHAQSFKRDKDTVVDGIRLALRASTWNFDIRRHHAKKATELTVPSTDTQQNNINTNQEKRTSNIQINDDHSNESDFIPTELTIPLSESPLNPENGDVNTSIVDDMDRNNSLSEDNEKYDYVEAAHYANDLLIAQSLMEGYIRKQLQPFDALRNFASSVVGSPPQHTHL